MPAAIGVRIRREIIERRQGGESFASIAREMSMAYVTVRGIYKHYEATGKVEPSYERCRHSEVRKDRRIYEHAVGMKGEHPSWGAGLIWVELAEEFEEDTLPSVRTLQRWFRRAGVAARPRDKVAKPSVQRGGKVHEVWALDAKEEIRLADGSYASWLTISDEASGAVLSAELFPHNAVGDNRSAQGQTQSPENAGAMGKTGADTDG